MNKMIKLRGHNLSLLAYRYLNIHTSESLKKMEIYGKGNEIFDQICSLSKTKPKTKIKIVEGLDSICENCPKMEPRCSKGKEDQFTLKEYGLTINKIYTIEELICKIINYSKNKSYRAPRDKWILTGCFGIGVDEEFYTI